MRCAMALGLALAMAATGLWAEAPPTSPRPLPRPVAGVEAAATPAAPDQQKPRRRPEGLAAAASGPALAPTVQPLAAIPRPRPRPEGLGASAGIELAAAPTPDPEPAPTKRKGREKASKKGSVCGDPAIRGEALAPIKGKVKGCGLDKPVRVTAIDGIRLNQPATVNCDTAVALKRWIDTALRPALGRRDLVELRIAASYVCRPRNNKKGAKISEHGRGKAVDVAGFVFADGTEWSILRDYNKTIRRAHKGACGIFGTTLGPGSDGYHEDHLHFDTASYRGGPYCR